MEFCLDLCTGCGMCAHVCTKNAITMSCSNIGFYVPVIDSASCVNCGACVRNCPNNANVKLNSQMTSKCAQANDLQLLMGATSGGVASVLSRRFVATGGVVYGAAFDGDMRVRHMRCETEEQTKKIAGSKYVQSLMSHVYSQIEKDLSSGRKVLFSGTPCQCSALSLAFGHDEKFYCCDFLCNGVGSPSVFAEHVKYLERLYRTKIVGYTFRPKSTSYLEPYELLVAENDRAIRIKAPHKKWGTIYYERIVVGASCDACKYRIADRVGDCTFADIPESLQSMAADQFSHDGRIYGASLFSINSDKGKWLFDLIKDGLTSFDVNEQVADKASRQKRDERLRESFCLEALRDYKRARRDYFGLPSLLKSTAIDIVDKFESSLTGR